MRCDSDSGKKLIKSMVLRTAEDVYKRQYIRLSEIESFFIKVVQFCFNCGIIIKNNLK